MPQRDQRWIEVTPSQFTHEAEGLNIVRSRLPQSPPFRAWSNFEFRDAQGKWHEVDLLVLGRRRLHLVELKYYTGALRGDDLTWRRDGKPAEDSPLKLARRKAQRLASKLQDEFVQLVRETGAKAPHPRSVVPFVQESVFLHHPEVRCLLPTASRTDLFGLDGEDGETGLPGISDRLLESATPNQSVPLHRDELIVKLMARIGVVQRRQREAGSWVIDEDSLGEGSGWQDWPAFHRVVSTNRARIRFLVTAPGAPATERAKMRRVAEHEFRIMSRLQNERLLRPMDMIENDLGIGLVYPVDERFQRLDLWFADQAGRVTLKEQLSLLRQVGQAVSYAHRSRVVHRGLTPHAVLVRTGSDGDVRVLVADWQSSGTITGAGETGQDVISGVGEGVTKLFAGTGSFRLGAADVDQRLAEAFQAPEGVWLADSDRVRLDVFALGALGYYILTGRVPASDLTTLRARLRREGGLDLAADLPQATPALRALILDATRPGVSDRLPDVRTFLERLEEAEQAGNNGVVEDVIDPLAAEPGALIDGRFRLERRLGSGSTATGLLVTDTSIAESGSGAVRVLKVALNDGAAGRLADEAKVLSGIRRHPRLVHLVEGPMEVGGRQALLLESAGDETLAEALRGRGRLSLDLLQRWGGDLLEALVTLDRASIDHRDIKPANLGVREGRGDRVKHLVLFDFSLSNAGATAVTAGTPPYLDPFLDTPQRGRYDSAAERYSAAVVLFEMATGTVPQFGDGFSDPASVPDEATVEPAMFDTTVAKDLVVFFGKALARDARQRFDTAADMLAHWRSIFAPVPTTEPDDAPELAAAAQPSTPLATAGLSARALSAVEPLGVITVGDLIAVDPVRLNHLSGVAEQTRREVKSRARQWRDRLGTAVLGRGAEQSADGSQGAASLPDPVAVAERLLVQTGSRAPARRRIAGLILGLEPGADAFATHAELGQAANVTRVRAAQQLNALQDGWSTDPECRSLLTTLADATRLALANADGVATVAELTSAVLAMLGPAQRVPEGASASRIAAGLVRFALDRVQELNKAQADDFAFAFRRRDGRTYLIAVDAALLDPAESLGHAADDLIDQARAADEPVVPAARATQRLREVWSRAVAGADPGSAILNADRLVRLGTALAREANLAGSGDLYSVGLPPATAITIALSGIGGTQAISAQEVQDRVRAKFPALPSLPERPRLDRLIEQAGLDLVYDDSQRAFRSLTRTVGSQGFSDRTFTVLGPLNRTLHADGPSGHRLAESAATRSFLAIGVDAKYADRGIVALLRRFGVARLDVTQVLIAAMKEQAAAVGLGWDIVLAADAAAPGTRDSQGLAALVQRSLPAVDAAIRATASASPEGTRPILLTDTAPLARYNHLNVLGPWADLATRRRQAIWILVPQLAGNTGPLIDRRPLPLAAPGQFMRLALEWIGEHAASPSAVAGAPVEAAAEGDR